MVGRMTTGELASPTLRLVSLLQFRDERLWIGHTLGIIVGAEERMG